jgi:WD repeat-containing protein 55
MECYNLFSDDIKPENEEVTQEPPDIFLKEQIFDVKFSPTANVIATSQVTGEVKLFMFNNEVNEEVMTFNHHQTSWRQVEFSEDGNYLFTGASDNTIGIITNGMLLHQVKKAHDSPINSIKYIENNAVIATGDDNGWIKIWDFRINSTKTKDMWVAEFKENEDTITGMELNAEKNKLLSTSNDGFLGVFDIRRSTNEKHGNFLSNWTLADPNSKFKPSLFAMSDCLDEELTSLCIIKSGKKVVVSTQEGIIMLFSWDWFGDWDDRMAGHPCSVSTMWKYNEDIVITGCDDGYVRAINLLPNKVISLVNYDADEDDLMPVSKLTIKNNLVAFTCNDEMVRIYDLEQFQDQGEDEEPTEVESQGMTKPAAADKEMAENSDADKNWEEIEDEIDSGSDSDEGDEEDEEDEQEEQKNQTSGGLYYSGQDLKWSKHKSGIDKKKRQDFFSGL